MLFLPTLFIGALLAHESTSFSTLSSTKRCSGESTGLSPLCNPKTPSLAATSPLGRATSLSTVSAGAQSSEAENNEGATIPEEIFNLVKNIVGAGVLSLPAGVAAFASAPSAIIPATALIASIGIASGYCFSLIGRVCSYTGAETYREAWEKTISDKTGWIPAAMCSAKTSLATVAYSMILADTFQALAHTAGFAAVTRTQSLLSVTGLFLLPLCLLKNLSSLAPFSLLGSIGMVYTTFAMFIRYIGKSYALDPAGRFLADVKPHLQPAFGTVGLEGALHPNSLILVCMLSTAYIAHFNAPKFYAELKNNTIPRFNKVVSTSYAISIAIFAAITSIGFLTFGQNCNGFILNNYANTDALISLARTAVAVSLIFSYPLAFTGVRDGIMDLMNVDPHKRKENKLFLSLTLPVLSAITLLALKIKDLSFVLSFGGATLGNALIYIVPAFMFKGAVKRKNMTGFVKKEVWLSMYMAAVGLVMGAIGARMAVVKAFS